MPRSINGEAHRHLRTLFGGGTAGGRSDGQLLERFNARDGPSAERAFGALVQRHGPMVLRVARSILRDRDLANDAFQAAFLALARRAESLWVRDSIGPWLHAVTVRISTRMRTDLARRRQHDERAARLAPTSCDPVEPDDLGATLHEEIARLPDRHRLPIVLCLVEGLTHDQAADRLGWPVGTVRSRLARGRDRLRDRLSRRGLAPTMIPITLGIGRSASEAVGASLLAATSRAAVSLTNGGLTAATGMVPAATSGLISTLWRWLMIHRISLVFGSTIGLTLAIGGAFLARSPSTTAAPPQENGAKAAEAVPDESEELIVRIYVVEGLVSPEIETRVRDVGGRRVYDEVITGWDADALIDLIADSVAPGTWRDHSYAAPGPPIRPGVVGELRLLRGQGKPALLVRHTPEVNDMVAKRIEQLRRLVDGLEIRPRLGLEPLPRLELEPLPEPASGPSPRSERGKTYRDPYVRVEEVPLDQDEDRRPGRLIPMNPIKSGETDTSRRIDALEQKLDAILEELRAIRKDDDR